MFADPAVAEVRLDAVRRNIEAIRRRTRPGTPICAAVKAEAYGHGFEQVLPALSDARVERLAVANLAEAIRLRTLGWSKPILSFGPELFFIGDGHRAERAREAVAAGVSCTICSIHEARELAAAAVKIARAAHVEIQIDTGMGRFGLLPEESEQLLAEVARCPHVVIDGVYTHFATADEPDFSFAREQLRRFSALVRRIEARGIPVRAFHAANSAAIFRLPESHLDQVRPGLAIYGYWGGPPDERPPDLYPSMRVVSRLAAVRRLPAGHPIGYGCTFTTSRESIIGTVPIGYADGYRRLFSNDAVMTIPRKSDPLPRPVPVVGRVSMDQINVDLTDAGDVRVGDEIVIIDDDPRAPNTVEGLARKMGTIPYEVTSLLGQRIHRKAVR